MEGNICNICNDKGVKKGVIAVLLILSLFLLIKTIGELKRLPGAGSENPVYNTLTVSGEGEVVAIPDIANVSFTVQTESLSIEEVQNSVSEKIEGIINYLKENGIAEKDIKTSGYSLYPRYEYLKSYLYPYEPTGKRNLVAYVVNENVTVKIRDLPNAGKIVRGLGELGATEISGLNFSFEDDEGMRFEARTLAIKDARMKARKLASDLGVSLGRITHYSEGRVYPGSTPYVMEGGRKTDINNSSVSAQFNPGESKIKSNISITYEIR